MRRISGYVLAGGAGTRMGADKSQILFEGITLAERAARVLDKVAESVKIVGGRSLVRPTVPDLVGPSADRASIHGLHAALFDGQAGWAAVLACDLPFVPSDLFHELIASRSETEPDAIVPMQPDGRPQPLAAIYRVERCLPVVESLISRGERRLGRLLEMLDSAFIEPCGTASSDAAVFLNVNTPAELQMAEGIARRTRTGACTGGYASAGGEA